MKNDIKFLDKYFKDFKNLVDSNNNEIKKKLINLKKILINTRKNKKKNNYFW